MQTAVEDDPPDSTLATPAPSGDLEEATRVHPSGDRGKYRAYVSNEWEIWGPNGGYMASIAMRAAAAESFIKQPASFYCHFLRPARFDWIDAEVSVVQRGRRSESIRVALSQQGKPVVEGLLRTALPGEGLDHEVGAPIVPRPETLPSAEELRRPDHPVFRFWKNIESRVLQPERFAEQPKPQPPVWREWYRFRPRSVFDDPVVDAARALVLIDTLGWPAAWMQHPGTALRAPNLDVAAFFHAPTQDSDWLLCEQVSPTASQGLVAASARIYGSDGRLLASGGAQLMCVAGGES
ncbi:MAG TPA: thioesterase family protein [Polyangiales bacterium]|jgi:acyl-CoA thioesterase-2|nr:thioesterase family protein [Polyangiales bacterium]